METKLQEALDAAWEKILIYCKKYAGCSVRDVQIQWKHNAYCWRDFGVTPQGVAYINYGNHITSRRGRESVWFGHPVYKDTGINKYEIIEDVVRNWPAIKEKLEERFKEEKLIFAFEP